MVVLLTKIARLPLVGSQVARWIAGRQLSAPHTYELDIGRLGSLIWCKIMFSNFRETHDLATRKRVKISFFLGTIAQLFAWTNIQKWHGVSGHKISLPANTILRDSLISFYTSLEQNCVRVPPNHVPPHFDPDVEMERHQNIADYLGEDIQTIFGGDGEAAAPFLLLFGELEALGFGTRRLTTSEWEQAQKLAEDIFLATWLLLGEDLDQTVHYYVWYALQEASDEIQAISKAKLKSKYLVHTLA